MKKLKHIKLFEEINPLLDRTGVSPMDAMNSLFKEFRKLFRDGEGKSLRDIDVDNEYKKHWIMFLDLCKKYNLKRTDVIDFIEHYIGQRKQGHVAPKLVNDDNFRNDVNKLIEDYTKGLNSSDFD
jgi:hypothetical protein